MGSVRIAIIGLAKAGHELAATLQTAGAEVIGFDIKPPKKPLVPVAESTAEAVADADIVLSLNSSSYAIKAATDSAPHLKADAIFADLNPGTPSLQKNLASIVGEQRFVDVAVLEPLLVSGAAAQRFSEALTPLGLELEVVSVEPGDASARALTRSILTKCLAGVVVDYMWAAEKMGLTEWAYDELQREFDQSSAETAKTYLRESGRDVKRREIEMLDVVEMLESVDYHSLFVPPTQLTYNKIYHSIKVPYSEAEEEY